MTTAPPTCTPPSPAEATDEAAFVAELRRLKTWSGRSFRQLERQATAAGDVLPASTAATMLGKHRLPREELLVAFVRACGLGEDDMRPWLATRAMIADGRIADDRNADATAVAPAASPRRLPTPRLRLAMAAAVLAMAFAGGAAFTAGLESESLDEQETVVLTP
jgi:hypothetical protein